MSFTGLLEDVGEDECVDAEEKGELGFARVELDLHLVSTFPETKNRLFNESIDCDINRNISCLCINHLHVQLFNQTIKPSNLHQKYLFTKLFPFAVGKDIAALSLQSLYQYLLLNEKDRTNASDK